MTQENIKELPMETIDSMRCATMLPRRKKNDSGLSKRPLAIGDNGADKKAGVNSNWNDQVTHANRIAATCARSYMDVQGYREYADANIQ